MAIRNILIVESFNDKAFIEILLEDLGLLQNTFIEIIHLHKFPDPDDPKKELRGKHNIHKRLGALNRDLKTKYADVSKVGIILDMDKDTLEKNLGLVNKALEFAFKTDLKLLDESKEITINLQTFAIEVSCFFTKGQHGQGNLETLLCESRKNPETPVPYADCLALWRECVSNSASPIQVTPGVYEKMWTDNFLRAKAYELEDRKKILNDFEDKKHEIIERLGKDIFDLNHSALSSMKAYLSIFKDE